MTFAQLSRTLYRDSVSLPSLKILSRRAAEVELDEFRIDRLADSRSAPLRFTTPYQPLSPLAVYFPVYFS